MNKLLKEAEKYTIYITVFLTPVVFLPTFFNPFLTPKIAILVLGVSLALIFRLTRIAVSGTFEFNQGPFDFPVFLIIAAYVVSGFYASPNRAEAFFLPGAATVIIAAGVLYFLANQLESIEKSRLMYVLIGSAVVVSLIYLLAITGLFEKIPSLPAAFRSRNFTPAGALLPMAIFLVTVIPYGLGLVLRTKDYLYKALLASATVIIAISLVIASFNMITDRANFRIASLDSSLTVVFDSLKTSAILGVGPSNYLTAYTRFRPITVNLTDDWLARYAHGRNFYLTAITETGLIGTFAFTLLIIVLARQINAEIKAREHKRVPVLDFKTTAIAGLFIVLAIFPATSPEVLVVMFLGLAMAAETRKFRIGVAALAQSAHMSDSRSSKVPAVIAITPFLVAVFYLLFAGGRALAAERTYKIAIDHLAKNEGKETYEALQRAINIAPGIDRYHITYSQINFLLANAIAAKGQDLNDTDRQSIGSLIEQAIREAKTTVALNPTRASNWEVLAGTYRNIIPLSKDAAGFAIQAYRQAVALDPMNPDLRIALGGVWYSIKDYDSAIDAFRLAVVAKPDHANARYNLAAAYREKGETERAIAELKVVLTLVDKDSKDYETAQKELTALEEKAASAPASASQGETLTAPETTEPKVEPPIELPEGAGPEISPTPSPTSSPSPTPTPAL